MGVDGFTNLNVIQAIEQLNRRRKECPNYSFLELTNQPINDLTN
jgi:hypothetical protein